MQERDLGCSGRLNASWTLGMKKFERKDHSSFSADRSLTCASFISGIIEID